MGDPHMTNTKLIKPMLLTASDSIPTGDDWIFQPKMDGFRTLLHYEQGRGVCLYTRHQNEVTRHFPEFQIELPVRSALFDGETVVLEKGKPVLEHALARLKSKPNRQQPPAEFVAFDLLELNGESLFSMPLIDRLNRLRELQLPAPLTVSSVFSEGAPLFEAICKMGLEGICGKRKNSLYIPDKRSPNWLKIKNYTYSQMLLIGIRFKPIRAFVKQPNGQIDIIKFIPQPIRRQLIAKMPHAPGTSGQDIVPMQLLVTVKHLGYTLNGHLREAVLLQLA